MSVIFTIGLVLLPLLSVANDSIWWDSGDVYLKIEVADNGWYVIDNEWLVQQNIEFDDINATPSVFLNGVRQTIYYLTEDGIDGFRFYFYGRANSMEFDNQLYLEGRKSLNKTKGLLYKYSPYFLTMNPNNFRERDMQLIRDTSELPKKMGSNCIEWDSFYFKPRLGLEQLMANSNYEDGEGFGSFPSKRFKFQITGSDYLELRLANLGMENQVQIRLNGKDIFQIDRMMPFEFKEIGIPVNKDALFNIEISGREDIILGSVCSGEVYMSDSIFVPQRASKVAIPDFHLDSSQYLVIASGKFKDGKEILDRYVQYRSNFYRSALYFTDDLENAFAFGHKHHPLFLSRFMAYLNLLNKMPEFIFLIGKGISYPMARNSNDTNYLPVYGYPGSDFFLIDPMMEHRGKISVGRLSVERIEEVEAYLWKVMDFERQKATFWKKRVLMTFGGKNQVEMDLNRRLMTRIIPFIQFSEYGGEVDLLERTIGENYYARMINSVNYGLGYKVFLGHGNITTTENALDHPQYFDVGIKYPVSISMGCQTGNPFTSLISLGEQYLKDPKGGSIAYIGSSGYGYPGDYNRWLQSYFSMKGAQDVQQPIGKVFNQSISQMLPGISTSATLATQLIFQGDPAITFNIGEVPVYSIPYSSITYDEVNQMISFDILNGGKVLQESIEVSLFGMAKPIRDTLPVFQSKTRYQVNIASNDLGEKISIYIQEDLKVEWPTQKFRNSATLVYPFDNAILIDKNPLFTLRSWLSKEYQIEWDTSYYFDSPSLTSISIAGNSGETYQVSAPIVFEDEQVYFWRVKDDVRSGEIFSFKISSLKGIGWSQTNTQQLNSNELEGIHINSDNTINRESKFNSFLIQAGVRTNENQFRSRLFMNGNRIVNSTMSPSFHVCIFDQWTGELKQGKAIRSPYLQIIEFIEKNAKQGDWVMLFTFQLEGEKLFPKGIDEREFLTYLHNQGAHYADSLQKNIPYILVFRKNVAVIDEKWGEDIESLIYMPYSFRPGSVKSKQIGPGVDWKVIQNSSYVERGFEFSGEGYYRTLTAEWNDSLKSNFEGWGIQFQPLKNRIIMIENLQSTYFSGKNTDFKIFTLPLTKDRIIQELDLEILLKRDEETKGFYYKNFDGILDAGDLLLPEVDQSGILQMVINLYDRQHGVLIDQRTDEIRIINEINLTNIALYVNESRYIRGQTIGKQSNWLLEFESDIEFVPQFVIINPSGNVDSIPVLPVIYKTNTGFKYSWKFDYEFDEKGKHQFKILFGALFVHPNIDGEINITGDLQPDVLFSYPNPFTSSTRFFYKFYGSPAEIDFKIFIFNVSGRLVKTITSQEFGLIKNGENLSDFIWDGTDTYGNQLAKGLYLFTTNQPKSEFKKIYKLK
jgi:hypothetical protein